MNKENFKNLTMTYNSKDEANNILGIVSLSLNIVILIGRIICYYAKER